MPSRRRYLRTVAGVSAVGVLAGCLLRGSETPSPAEFVHDGSLVDEASDGGPMRVELRLTNESEQSVELLPASDTPLLADIPRLDGPSGSVVFFPPDAPGISAFGLADERLDGCWRFVTADGDVLYRSVIETTPAERRLDAGVTVTMTHDVYYGEPTGECFSAGAYETTIPIHFASDEHTGLSLGYRLTVDGGGARIEAVGTADS